MLQADDGSVPDVCSRIQGLSAVEDDDRSRARNLPEKLKRGRDQANLLRQPDHLGSAESDGLLPVAASMQCYLLPQPFRAELGPWRVRLSSEARLGRVRTTLQASETRFNSTKVPPTLLCNVLWLSFTLHCYSSLYACHMERKYFPIFPSMAGGRAHES
jgi:hypothetical protein